ncbi:MAG: DUF4214 domain-containing protein [Pseudoxanthomonas sp.]
MPHPPQVHPADPVQALSVDQIMAQVRAEVVRRGGSFPEPAVATVVPAHGGLARWQPAAPRIPLKRQYALPELLSFSDRDFIENAYRAVLRRAPDDTGVVHFLERLRDGRLSKVEVLAALRWSPEGEKEGVHVDGLLAPFLLQKWRRKPLVGPVLGWVHSLARLARVSDRQSLLDAAQAREAHELGRVVNLQAQQLDLRFARAESILATHDMSLRAERDRAVAAAEALASQLQQLRECLGDVSGMVEALGHDLDALAARVEAAPDLVPVIRLMAERLERLSAHEASLGGRVDESSQVSSESAVAARKVS